MDIDTIWIAHYSGIKYIIYIYCWYNCYYWTKQCSQWIYTRNSYCAGTWMSTYEHNKPRPPGPSSLHRHAHNSLAVDTPRQASISTHLHRVTVTTWYKDARFHYAIVNTQQITSFSGTWLQDRRAHRKTRLQMHLNHAHNGNRPTLTPAPHTPQTISITISMGQYNLKLI